ncbi:MAG: UPF0104 family protein [Candidatus Electrothrix sp. ATG2]|nr:UPF0104 family protein [Candidatus Electrothrix sp. ATG2]
MGILVGCCIVINMMIGAFNSWLILNTLHKLPFPVFLKAYFYSWTTGLITPGQAGDASLILFLKTYGISLRQSGISYLLDKIITLSIFFLIGWYGSYILVPELKFIWFYIVIAMSLAVIIASIFIKLSPNHFRFASKFHALFRDIAHESKKLKQKQYILAINILLTFVKWIAVTACYYTAFLCFNTNAPWPEIGVIPVLSTLVGYIPVSIGGIGTVELTATQLFARAGVEQSAVLSTYLLIRSIQYCIAILMLALFAWKNYTLNSSG